MVRRSSRRRGDRGQTLLLMPAAFLIVIVLISLVIEAAAMHLHKRQLVDLADSIANDAATYGFDVEAFRASGEIRIDESTAASIVGSSIAISELPTATVVQVRVSPGPEPTVEIDLRYTHEYVVAGTLVGGSDQILDATGQATLVLSNP